MPLSLRAGGTWKGREGEEEERKKKDHPPAETSEDKLLQIRFDRWSGLAYGPPSFPREAHGQVVEHLVPDRES